MKRIRSIYVIGVVLLSAGILQCTGFTYKDARIHRHLHPSITLSHRKYIHRPTIIVSERRNHVSSHGLLKMYALPVATAGSAAIFGAMAGGIVSGGLHAISGPDHLAALIPKCCGQRWFRAGRFGALWAIGHGLSAASIGITAYALKTKVSMHAFTHLTSGLSSALEVIIGISLVLTGLFGLKEARETAQTFKPKSLSAAAAEPWNNDGKAALFNGWLHGFSWDGMPSLAPALAVASWRGNILYLFGYVVGTIITMSVATSLFAECTRRIGDFSQRDDIPEKLSFLSSAAAIAVGLVWVTLAVL